MAHCFDYEHAIINSCSREDFEIDLRCEGGLGVASGYPGGYCYIYVKPIMLVYLELDGHEEGGAEVRTVPILTWIHHKHQTILHLIPKSNAHP